MLYELIYYRPTGECDGVLRNNHDGSTTSFGLDPDNTDFQAFLKWNAEQAVPLDLESTIPPEINYSISPSVLVIPADGVASAEVVVHSDPGDATAELLYGGVPLSVPLVDGVGTAVIKSDIAGVLLITGASGELANIKVYVYAGEVV